MDLCMQSDAAQEDADKDDTAKRRHERFAHGERDSGGATYKID